VVGVARCRCRGCLIARDTSPSARLNVSDRGSDRRTEKAGIRKNRLASMLLARDPPKLDRPALPAAKRVANRTRPDVTRIYRQSAIMLRAAAPRCCCSRSDSFDILDGIGGFAIFVRGCASVRSHNETERRNEIRYQFERLLSPNSIKRHD